MQRVLSVMLLLRAHVIISHFYVQFFFFYFAAIAVDIAYASFSWWALIFSFYIDPFFTAIFFPLALFTLHVFRVCVLNWSHIKTIWSRYLWTCTCYMLMELLLEKCGRNACHRQTFKLMLCICTYKTRKSISSSIFFKSNVNVHEKKLLYQLFIFFFCAYGLQKITTYIL